MRKETYKVLLSTALGVAAGLSACEATGVTNFIPNSEPKNPNSTEIDPTQTEFAKITSATFESITNNETRKSIIDSLPTDRPQSNGVEDVFSLKVGDKKFNFVMYELTDDEISNGVTIENSEGIKTVQSVATYTEFEGYDGTKSWVRLIGITSKLDDPNIVWFYDSNGFPTEERQIDTSRAVFGYSINSKDNILYQPLITVPTSIAGYDYTQALPVVLSGEVPPSMQIDVMYVKPEDVSEAESTAIALFDKYGVAPATYTLAEVDGIMVGTDKETGAEIFRDGRFEIGFAAELAKKDCEPTNIKPQSTGPFAQQNYDDDLGRYIHALVLDPNYNTIDGREFFTTYVLVDREKQCWAFADGDSLVYRNETGILQTIPTKHLTEDEVFEFIFNR